MSPSATAKNRHKSSKSAADWWLLALLCALGLGATAWWLLRSRAPWGRDGWFLTPHDPWPLAAWWLPLCALLIFGGLCATSLYDRFRRAKTRREQTTSLRLALIALMLLSPAWNWGLLGAVGSIEGTRTGAYNVLASQFSDVATEYLGTAYQIENARQFSQQYATKWQKPRSAQIAHVATHPPGATLFSYVCRRIVNSNLALQNTLSNLAASASGDTPQKLWSDLNDIRLTAARSGGVNNEVALPFDALATATLCAILMALSLTLAIPAIYILASHGSTKSNENPDKPALPPSASTCRWGETETSEARGVLACALWVLAPTVGLFAPTLDAIIACGSLWMLAFICKYLQMPEAPKSARYLIGAGIVLGLTAFVSFGALTMGAIGALWLLSARQFRAVGIFVLGIGVTFLGIMLLSGANLPLIFSQAMKAHRLATLQTRSYSGWLWLNPLFFAVFAGWPVIAAWIIGLSRGAKIQPRGVLWKLAVNTLAVMFLISVLGSVRGETERLWMFLLAPFCVLAAHTLLELTAAPRVKLSCIAVLVALQALQTLFLAATLAPLVLPV